MCYLRRSQSLNKRRHYIAVSAHDCIQAKTIRPNERLSVLSNLQSDQADNMEPLPQFSRDVIHGRRRYEAAKKAAEEAAKQAENNSDEE